jgi:hypothetical protein
MLNSPTLANKGQRPWQQFYRQRSINILQAVCFDKSRKPTPEAPARLTTSTPLAGPWGNYGSLSDHQRWTSTPLVVASGHNWVPEQYKYRQIMSLDLVLAYSDDGKTIVVHRADCPDVRKQAAEGKPVLTMFDCQRAPKDGVKRRSCMKVH